MKPLNDSFPLKLVVDALKEIKRIIRSVAGLSIFFSEIEIQLLFLIFLKLKREAGRCVPYYLSNVIRFLVAVVR